MLLIACPLAEMSPALLDVIPAVRELIAAICAEMPPLPVMVSVSDEMSLALVAI